MQQPAQYFASPLLLNPALTGKFDGPFRITSMLPSVDVAFITSSLSVEVPISLGSSSSADTWGIGLSGSSGRSTNGVLATTDFAISTAYHKSLDMFGNHQIGIGFQASRHRNQLNTDLTLDEAEKNALPDLPLTSIPSDLMRTDEFFKMSYPTYVDMSAGFLYSGTTNGTNNIYVGASGYHLNRPCESTNGKEYFSLEPRYMLHAGAAFPQAEGKRTLYFSTMVSQQAQVRTVTAGSVIGRMLNTDEESPRYLYVGAWGRYNNYYHSLMPYFGIEKSGFLLGVSYEMIFAKEETVMPVRRGGLEFTLVYTRRYNPQASSPMPRF